MIAPEVEDRLRKLLSLLRHHSMSRDLEWERTGKEEYTLSTGRSSYTVATRDQDGQEPYVFGMYDSQGVPVAVFDSSDPEYPADIRGQIRELWTVVNTSAAQVAKFLDDALKELQDLPPF
jgi:hypothetical protein